MTPKAPTTLSTLEQAFAHVANGYRILPLNPDTKKPVVDSWDVAATKDGETLEGWFTGTRWHVGIVTGEAVLLDLDKKVLDDGTKVNGRKALRRASLDVPDGFSYRTLGDGWHHWFRSGSTRLNNAQDYRLADSTQLAGVDRRAHGGYARVIPGMVIPAPADLPVVPSWFEHVNESHGAAYAEGTDHWLATLGAGTPDAYIAAMLTRWGSGYFGYGDMTYRQRALVGEGAKGRPGVARALEALRGMWLARDHKSGDALHEWNVSLDGAILKYGAFTGEALTTTPDALTAVLDDNGVPVEGEADEAHARAVQDAVERLRVNGEAKVAYLVERGGFGLFVDGDVTSALDLTIEDDEGELIAGVLGLGEVDMMFGDSYTGKTYAALDMALSVATGTPYQGRAVQQGKVLYMAMEGSRRLVHRIAAWSKHHGGVDVSDLHVYGRTANLMHDDTVAMLAERVRHEGYALVVVDTLSRSVVGANDSDTEAMGGYVGNLTRVREAGDDTTLLVIHHSKKEEPEEYRGSTVLFAAMDRVLCFRAESKTKPERKMLFQKVKDGTIPETMHMTFMDAGASAVLVADTAPSTSPVRTLLGRLLLESDGQAVLRTLLKTSLVGNGLYETDKSADNAIRIAINDGLISQHRSEGGNWLTLTPTTL